MATKLYLQRGRTPAVTPNFSGSWNAATPNWSTADTTKQSTTMGNTINNYSDSTSGRRYNGVISFVYGPFSGAGSSPITGYVDAQMRGYENSASLNANWALTIRVVYGTASPFSTRGTPLSLQGGTPTAAPPEFTTTQTNRRFRGGTTSNVVTPTLTNVTPSAGDYLVIEMGHVKNNTTTSRYSYLSYGDDNATDLGTNDSDTAAYNPWVNFSSDLPPLSPLIQLTTSGAISTSFSTSTASMKVIRGVNNAHIGNANLIQKESGVTFDNAARGSDISSDPWPMYVLGGNLTLTSDNTTSWEGSRSIKLAFSTNTASSASAGLGDLTHSIKPSTSYRLSVYANIPSGRQPKFTVQGKPGFETVGETTVTGTGSWARYDFTITTLSKHSSVFLYINNYNETTAFDMYVDAFQLEFGTSATTWARPTNSGIEFSVPSAALTVTAASFKYLTTKNDTAVTFNVPSAVLTTTATIKNLTGKIAGGMDLEVHLMITQWGLGSNSSSDTSFTDQRISLNTNDYDGATYYFETNADNFDTSDHTISLCKSDGTVLVTNTAAPGEWFPRVSNSFTPTSGNDEYYVKLQQTPSTDNLWCGSARIVVVQKGATKTRLQIPMAQLHGSTNENSPPLPIWSTTSTSYEASSFNSQLADTNFTKEANKQSSISTWVFEAVLGNSGSNTTSAELRNITDSTDITASEVTRNGTGLALVSTNLSDTATNFHDGDNFEVYGKTSAGTGYIYNVNLYVKLTDLTKFQQWIRNSLGSWAGKGNAWLHNQRFLYTASNWNSPTIKHEMYGYCADNANAFTIQEFEAFRDPDSGSGHSTLSGSGMNFNSGTKAHNRSSALTLSNGKYYMGFAESTTNNSCCSNSTLIFEQEGENKGIKITLSSASLTKLTGNIVSFTTKNDTAITFNVPTASMKVTRGLKPSAAIATTFSTSTSPNLLRNRKLVPTAAIVTQFTTSTSPNIRLTKKFTPTAAIPATFTTTSVVAKRYAGLKPTAAIATQFSTTTSPNIQLTKKFTPTAAIATVFTTTTSPNLLRNRKLVPTAAIPATFTTTSPNIGITKKLIPSASIPLTFGGLTNSSLLTLGAVKNITGTISGILFTTSTISAMRYAGLKPTAAIPATFSTTTSPNLRATKRVTVATIPIQFTTSTSPNLLATKRVTVATIPIQFITTTSPNLRATKRLVPTAPIPITFGGLTNSSLLTLGAVKNITGTISGIAFSLPTTSVKRYRGLSPSAIIPITFTAPNAGLQHKISSFKTQTIVTTFTVPSAVTRATKVFRPSASITVQFGGLTNVNLLNIAGLKQLTGVPIGIQFATTTTPNLRATRRASASTIDAHFTTNAVPLNYKMGLLKTTTIPITFSVPTSNAIRQRTLNPTAAIATIFATTTVTAKRYRGLSPSTIPLTFSTSISKLVLKYASMKTGTIAATFSVSGRLNYKMALLKPTAPITVTVSTSPAMLIQYFEGLLHAHIVHKEPKVKIRNQNPGLEIMGSEGRCSFINQN